MRKRTSKRRWKARCARGRAIPMEAIVDHGLGRWFSFAPICLQTDSFQAKRKHAKLHPGCPAILAEKG